MDRIAGSCGVLAWLMTRPGVVAPIASATTAEHVKDLVAATELELAQDALEVLSGASAARARVHGGR